MYRPGVRYDLIAQAARELPCPVMLNGNVHSGEQAMKLVSETGVCGLMIGRGAIRNPWLFQQIRQYQKGEPQTMPSGREVLHYIRELWDSQTWAGAGESAQVQRMKKFMNFLGEGVPGAKQFLHDVRRAQTHAEFFRLCEGALDHNNPMPLIPLPDETIPMGG
jgi:tRNA-dihydrouridine synthase B